VCKPEPVSPKTEDRFDENVLRKKEIIERLQNCKRVRITDFPYNKFGWGKVIIAVPGHVLIWFPSAHTHLCFLREPV
jgi:hypothetical protein